MSQIKLPLLVIVAALAAAVGFLVVATLRSDDAAGATASRVVHPLTPPFVIFRALAPREAYGYVSVQRLPPATQPFVSPLSCDRLHYAGGRGLCATREQTDGGIANVAYVFDHRFEREHTIVLDGLPTRLRVSPNGRYGAITTYAEEESPEGERLATRTRIVDMTSGRRVADLGDFRVENRDLPPIHGPLDVVGVAFEGDGERFFATVSTANERYLVAGSLGERRLSTIRTGVTSEALSPDGRRLAVKRLLSERGFWQLAVIELGAWTEQDLRQGPHSVDDQVEWFDNHNVLYHDVDGDSTALWVLPIDGINGPRVLIKDAYSGTVQR